MALLCLGALACLGSACSEPTAGVLPGGHAPAPRPLLPAGRDFRLAPGDLPPGRNALRFGLAPTVGGEAIEDLHDELLAYVGTLLEVEITPVVSDSYQHLIEMVARAQVDLAILPPLAYVVAREEAPTVRLLAAKIEEGRASYSGLVLVRASSALESLADLRGQKIAFVEERSASGFLFPLVALKRHGLEIGRDFEHVFADSHVAAIWRLFDGSVAAAATASGMFALARAELDARGTMPSGPQEYQTRILAKTGEVPYDALCATSALPASADKRILEAFMTVHHHNPAARDVLEHSGRLTGWAPADDELYEGVREVRLQLGERPGGEAAEWGSP